MSRPRKCRRICALPRCSNSGPLEGATNGQAEMVVEGYEAIRLIDLLGYTQEEYAAQTGVAHSTVQRVYNTARCRPAQALVERRRLHISGGSYVLYPRGEECPGRGYVRRNYSMRRCDYDVCLQSKGNQEVMKMKITVTYKNGQVFQYFGHTEQLKIYEAAEGEVISARVVRTSGSGHGALADLLRGLGMGTLTRGGIDDGTYSTLAETGIQLYPGTSGSADAQVGALLDGSLAYDPNTIYSHHDHGEGHIYGHHHEGGHTCGGHDHGCGHHGWLGIEPKNS